MLAGYDVLTQSLMGGFVVKPYGHVWIASIDKEARGLLQANHYQSPDPFAFSTCDILTKDEYFYKKRHPSLPNNEQFTPESFHACQKLLHISTVLSSLPRLSTQHLQCGKVTRVHRTLPKSSTCRTDHLLRGRSTRIAQSIHSSIIGNIAADIFFCQPKKVHWVSRS